MLRPSHSSLHAFVAAAYVRSARIMFVPTWLRYFCYMFIRLEASVAGELCRISNYQRIGIINPEGSTIKLYDWEKKSGDK